jgi:hypothetical protein
MKSSTLLDFTGEKITMMSEKFNKAILKRRMNKMDKWKPGIIASMREEAENRCQKEYNEEIEKLNDEIYELKHLTRTQASDVNKYKAKFEEYKELYDKIFDKHEAKTAELGETKEKLSTTEEDLKVALDENTPLGENVDFVKELKMLVARCNNEKYNKAESMSSFSAKWNVSLKEVLDDEEKIVEFKWKEIQ